jgi:hypothetical protein
VFDTQQTRLATDVTYDTDQADPTHTRAETSLADSGTETWAMGFGGRITGDQNRRFGWFDKDAGLLMTASYDGAGDVHPGPHRLSLMVAVPQPAAATAASIPGLYRLAGLDIGTSVGTPSAHSSTHDTTPFAGSLDVASTTQATLALDATTRAVYTLTGEPPLADMTWTMSAAVAPVGASSTPLTLSLDAAGNHLVATDERWFAFSGDGRYVLGVTRGEPTRLARGILLGVR